MSKEILEPQVLIPAEIDQESPAVNFEKLEERRAVLLGHLRLLKAVDFNKEPERYREMAKTTYQEMEEFFSESGLTMTDDVSSIYRYYINNNLPLIVRRDDPERAVNLVYDEPIKLSFDPNVVGDRGDKYANCALWPYGANPVEGIKNAFLEGKSAAGPVVTMLAFKQNSDTMTVEEPIGKMMQVGDLSRGSVKILSGEINRSDLKFIIVRMPRKFFPEEKLSAAEKQNSQPQIFRGFVLKK